MKPEFASTRLELRARVPAGSGNRTTVGPPLAGCEIHAKYPGEENTELVGLTDYSGGIDLLPTEKPLRLFYIKNGGQLLARLPLVVGQQTAITANVMDDDPRLRAEAYIKSLQSRVIDLVARREILAVRIRSKINKGEIEEARQLVSEFRSLTTSVQLTRELDDMQRRSSNVPGITGKRISKVFQDGQKLLAGFLDPEMANKLAREVTEAEQQGPATTPSAEPAAVEVPPTT